MMEKKIYKENGIYHNSGICVVRASRPERILQIPKIVPSEYFGNMSSEDPFYNRRVKGTELQKLRHRAALGILALSGLFGLAFHYLSKPQAILQRLKEANDENREAAEARRFRMMQSLPMSAATIRKKKQEEEDSPVS